MKRCLIEDKAAEYMREHGIRLTVFANGQIGFLIPEEKPKRIALVLRLLRRLRRLSVFACRGKKIDPAALIA